MSEADHYLPLDIPRPEVVEGTTETVLQTPVWSYLKREVAFPGGVTRSFHTVHKGPGVTIVPWMSHANGGSRGLMDQELLMIPQVRPNAGNKVGWCFPAGGIDPIDNGDTLAAAARELAEEAGAVATGGYVNLGTEYTAVHFSDNLNHTVLAKGVEFGDTAIEAYESIGDARSFPIGEIFEMTQTISPEGVPYIYDGVTIGCLGKAALYIASK